MNKSILPLWITLLLGCMLWQSGCKNKKEKTVVEQPPVVTYKTDTTDVSVGKGTKPPIINITDTLAIKRIVLVMRDSAATSERIGAKMAVIYKNLLPAIIKEQNLQITGPRIAWYKSSSPPFFFEAGIPVNKKPVKLPKNVFVKTINADSAVVVHYYGPYELTFQAYEAVKEWMVSYKKRSAGIPYEEYIGEMYDSTGKANDPYRVRTDIIFPRR